VYKPYCKVVIFKFITNLKLRIMDFVLSVKLRVIISHPNLLVYFGDILLNVIFINCSWVIAVIYKVY